MSKKQEGLLTPYLMILILIRVPEYKEIERQDKEMVERWKGEADSILVFVCADSTITSAYFLLNNMFKAGLFSAIGAVSFVETYKWLSPDSGDETVEILAQLVNVTQKIALTPGSSEPFKRTFDIVAVNVIWFASINICVICAVLATLIQQWVRRYMALAQGRDTPQERMRVRDFLYQGLNKYYMPQVCQLLSMGLHLSIGLYALGFLVFIFHIDSNFLIYALLGFSLVPPTYGLLTILPIFFLDFPYSTPFSALMFCIWHLVMLPINPGTANLFSCFLPKMLTNWGREAQTTVCGRPKGDRQAMCQRRSRLKLRSTAVTARPTRVASHQLKLAMGNEGRKKE